MKVATLSDLQTCDAMQAGQTMRALAVQERPNPEAAEVLGRVGDWLVNLAHNRLRPRSLAQVGTELVGVTLHLCGSDKVRAMTVLSSALIALSETTSNPRHALSELIDTLADVRDEMPLLEVAS